MNTGVTRMTSKENVGCNMNETKDCVVEKVNVFLRALTFFMNSAERPYPAHTTYYNSILKLALVHCQYFDF